MTKTNFEKIKEMKIEEAIEFFRKYMDCLECPAYSKYCIHHNFNTCRKFLKKWLESECKE